MDDEQLLEINQLLSKLVPEIRLIVFKKRAPHFFEEKIEKVEEISTEEDKTVSSQKSHKKRGKHLNNPVKVFKHIYDRNGESQITKKDIEQESRKLGVDVGSRSDKFLMEKRDKDSHKLFIREGKGYIPTHYGRIYLKGISGIIESTKPSTPELEEDIK